eukprot:gene565-1090_t
MSISIDFSGMFKMNSEENVKLEGRAENSTKIRQQIFEPSQDFPKQNTEDSAWISKTLKDLNYDVQDSDIVPGIISCLQGLIYERFHLQEQNNALVIDCSKTRSQLEMYSREKDNVASQLIMAKQDLNFANGKMAALKNEQRELRCQWLSEKSDLESRCFQSQTLFTQMQGTLRKKDKDYDKLQQQLSKLVKDSQRQQKAFITLSKPLPRSSSQVRVTTIKDAELLAASETIRGLQIENNNLRQAVNDLTSSYGAFQAKMTTFVAAQTAPLSLALASPSSTMTKSRLQIKVGNPGEVEGEGEKGMGEEHGNNNGSDENRLPSQHNSTDSGSGSVGKKPNSASKSKSPPAVSGTESLSLRSPDSSSTSRLVSQAGSVVKRLSARMDTLALHNTSDTLHNNTENNDISNTAAAAPSTADMAALQKQLDAALALVREQDWLIHVALVGKLPSIAFDEAGDDDDDLPPGHSHSHSWSDGESQFDDEHCSPRRSLRRSFLESGKKSSRRVSLDMGGMGSPLMADFLPPASPETMRVLQAAGWPLPRLLVPSDLPPIPPTQSESNLVETSTATTAATEREGRKMDNFDLSCALGFE